MKTPKQRVDELKYANDFTEAREELYRMVFDTERDVRAAKDGPVVGWVIDAAREVLCQLNERGRAEIDFVRLSNAVAALDGRLPTGESRVARLEKALLDIAEHGEGGGTDKFLAAMARRALA